MDDKTQSRYGNVECFRNIGVPTVQTKSLRAGIAKIKFGVDFEDVRRGNSDGSEIYKMSPQSRQLRYGFEICFA